jgi:hypothetical protein
MTEISRKDDVSGLLNNPCNRLQRGNGIGINVIETFKCKAGFQQSFNDGIRCLKDMCCGFSLFNIGIEFI